MNDSALIQDPFLIFVYFTGVIGFIFWLSTKSGMKGFFKYLPPLIWTYFLPMLSTNLGITPESSVLYSFLRRSMLPFLLVLLLLATDIKAIWRLGLKAIGTMLFGSLGIVLGAIVSFWIFGRMLPPETWKGVAALSGSWIGGSANMATVAESLNTNPDIYAPLIVVDTVVGYTWLGILIALACYQDKIDKWNKADVTVLHEIAEHLHAEEQSRRRPMSLSDFTTILGIGFVVSTVCMKIGALIPSMKIVASIPNIDEVMSGFAWGILLLTAVSVILSMTRLRELEFAGAGHMGYGCLYLLLASIGAQANVAAVIETPAFLFMGIIWILIHGLVLFFGAWLLKSPMFLFATSSMANIGGTSSAPVVAAAYQPSMAPVGLLMAIFGGIIGTPLALLAVGNICAKLAQ